MRRLTNTALFIFIFYIISSCEGLGLSNKIIDEGDGISIEFIEGLNDDDNFKLKKLNENFYYLQLDTSKNQTIQRITGRLLRDGYPI